MFKVRSQGADQSASHPVTVSLDLKSIWRATWVVLGALGIVALLSFITSSAGTAIFLIAMSFFLALAMEPAVKRLATKIPRSLATLLVMLLLAAAIAVFTAAFGSLLISEIRSLIEASPTVLAESVNWVNRQFHTDYDINKLLSDFRLTPERVAGYASTLAGGVFGILGSVVSTLFNLFVVIFFVFYLSAGMPKLRTWIAGLFPHRQQQVVLTVWELLMTKVGGYVSARFILAIISATVHGVFMMLIGMPYFLALGLWTGLVAQFIPNIGTYVSIALPVMVGLTSDNWKNGLFVLLFAVCYQQVENLTIEPRISARAVDVHPAVSFGSALIGVQMFGLAGGVLGVPIAATLMAVLDLYKKRYEVLPIDIQRADELADSTKGDQSARAAADSPHREGDSTDSAGGSGHETADDQARGAARDQVDD